MKLALSSAHAVAPGHDNLYPTDDYYYHFNCMFGIVVRQGRSTVYKWLILGKNCLQWSGKLNKETQSPTSSLLRKSQKTHFLISCPILSPPRQWYSQETTFSVDYNIQH